MKQTILTAPLKSKAPCIFMGLLVFSILSLAQVKGQGANAVETSGGKSITSSSLAKNPKKATLLSAILPGAGQVYNNKAWKVPILYAGIMTDIYFMNYNNRRYKVFREALIAFDDGEPNQFPNLNRQALVRNIDYWRRNRDMTFLLMGAIYALNIIDANVDAHLSGFDISDDLALKFEPHYESFSAQNHSLGFALKLKF